MIRRALINIVIAIIWLFFWPAIIVHQSFSDSNDVKMLLSVAFQIMYWAILVGFVSSLGGG